MKPTALASLASIVVLLIAGGTYLVFGVVRVSWLDDTLTATLQVPDSGGLAAGSKVLLSGVEIGRVTAVSHTSTAVEVRLRIDSRYPVPAASAARIEALSALGEPYLDFRPADGGGPYLRDGQTVPARNVQTPVSLPEVAADTTGLLRQLDPAALTSIVDTFSIALAGTDRLTPEIARATDLLAATILSRSAVLRQLLLDLQAHAPRTGAIGSGLAEAAQPWQDFGPRVAEVADALAGMIRAGQMPQAFHFDDGISLGLLPFLEKLSAKIEALGPELQELLPLLAALAATATRSAGQLDLSALITQALHATTLDGTLRLQLAVK
ncbi:MlaD family protein [Nocardia sp. XZ_19_385]|uniref:MlaD family protein n=1 Tax=Nocardia sp. XZ_19_385 TaxID=2769488 RepID=UPI00188FAC88|nr:MlaD family protein [Nocardia sp. XZ_19_385]